jgi:hypothetical protein
VRRNRREGGFDLTNGKTFIARTQLTTSSVPAWTMRLRIGSVDLKEWDTGLLKVHSRGPTDLTQVWLYEFISRDMANGITHSPP